MHTGEEWRAVVGYEGLYEVSDQGRVRSFVSGRLRKPQPQHHGHLKVILCDSGRRRGFHVHTLVLTAFVGPKPLDMECRHLFGDPADNRLTHLAWGTPSENKYDQVRHGTDHHASKIECDSGHPFDDLNTYVYRTAKGGEARGCRECRRESVRRYRASKRAQREEAA